jgi:hypothetical protein
VSSDARLRLPSPGLRSGGAGGGCRAVREGPGLGRGLGQDARRFPPTGRARRLDRGAEQHERRWTPVLRTLFIAASGGPSLTVFGQNGGGLTQIDTSSSGGSAGASGGTVRVEGSGSGTQVILTAPQLEVRHLVGQAVGSMVANSGNDVTIDVDTVVDIQIGNGNPLNLGPNMLRVDTLASDVAARLVR